MREFALSDAPLDPEALKRGLCGDASGGFVSFEGWVRDHNEGKRVHRLEYEAYAALAEAEGARVIAEARERFALHAAACVHRVGALAIGDIAVWVGAASAHRAEAFAACRYIIDEIKHRVPIWKKEHYADGDSGWVNCEACAHPHSHTHAEPLPDPAQFYARQTILPDVGERGQAALGAARVLVVGAGGLGCAALPFLAAAGVGTIGVCDGDTVDVSNLHRQVLFGVGDVGQPKAALAAVRLRAQNPYITVNEYATRVDAQNAPGLTQDYDYVLDCTDNFETKFLLNDVCTAFGKTLIQASIYQYEGQLLVVHPDRGAPCFRCLWPEDAAVHCVGNCAEAGVLGAVAGTLGTLQAQETLKQILGLPGALKDEMLFFDLATFSTRRIRASVRARCPACASKGANTVAPAPPPNASLELGVADIAAQRAAGFEIIDLRDPGEIASAPLPWPATPVDPASVNGGAGPFAADGRYVLVCTRGLRSKYVAIYLRARGVREVYSLAGGASALARR